MLASNSFGLYNESMLNESPEESVLSPLMRAKGTHEVSNEIPTNEALKEPKASLFAELTPFALIALAIVIPIRLWVAEPFIVNGASMQPTFENGDYLIVDQLSFRFRQPERGEVLIFRYPLDESKFFVKRLIGLPGETVEISNGVVSVRGVGASSNEVLEEEYAPETGPRYLKVELGTDEYFVLGDNRAASSDSRIWGPVANKQIVGRPILRLLPPSGFNVLPGNYRLNN